MEWMCDFQMRLDETERQSFANEAKVSMAAVAVWLMRLGVPSWGVSAIFPSGGARPPGPSWECLIA